MYFSFIFPVCNEEKYLESQLKKFDQWLSLHRIKVREILLIENGSTDNTEKIILKLEKKNKLIRGCQIKGASYGRAVKHGLLSATGDYIFLLNVDFFDLNFLEKSIKELDKYDVIVGSKVLMESKDNRNYLRKSRTIILAFVMKYFLGYKGTDTHGIKVFKNRESFKKIVLSCFCKHDLFDTELLLRLTRKGNKLLELPVDVIEIRKSRYKKIWLINRTLKDFGRIIIYLIFQNKKFKYRAVVADDYGISDLVNRAITDQVRGGTVDGVAVMPNLVKKNDLNQNTNYSMHINLTRGKPLSRVKNVSTLVKNNGVFYSTPELLIRFVFRLVKKSEIEMEIENQIKKMREYGIEIESLNSEQHIHLFSPVREIVYKLMNRYGIKAIRSERSTQNYLRTKPLRFSVYAFFRIILAIIYFDFKPNRKQKDVLIVHPGVNFD